MLLNDRISVTDMYKMARRVNISLDEEQMSVLDKVKGFGKKDAEKVKNILMAYLSEKGYLGEFNKHDSIEEMNEGKRGKKNAGYIL